MSMNRREFTKSAAGATAALALGVLAMPTEAAVVPVEAVPRPDIETLAACWVYGRMREYDEQKRSQGGCGSDLTWGDTSKAEAFLADKLRARTESVFHVPFYTGLAYWTGEAQERIDPEGYEPPPIEHVVYKARFDFSSPDQCFVDLTFGGRSLVHFTTILRSDR